MELRHRISGGYSFAVRKVLVSAAGETRSSFLRRAALAEVHRLRRPIDDPAVRRAFEQLMQTAERRDPISTAEALKARDRGRR
jgi:hypothetical protein